jgi:hypothetical protein
MSSSRVYKRGVVINSKNFDPRDQTIAMNPIGTLALVTLFRPIVTASINNVPHDKYVLKESQHVDIIEIGTRDPDTKMFVNSFLHYVVDDMCIYNNRDEHDEQYSQENNISFIPLKNTNRLRQSMIM